MSNKKTREDLLDQIKGNIEMLKNTAIEDLDVLDIEYQLDGSCNLKEIVLTLTIGGPRIDLKLNDYTILGYWGNEEVDYPIFEKESKTRSAIDALFYRYKEQFKANLS